MRKIFAYTLCNTGSYRASSTERVLLLLFRDSLALSLMAVVSSTPIKGFDYSPRGGVENSIVFYASHNLENFRTSPVLRKSFSRKSS